MHLNRLKPSKFDIERIVGKSMYFCLIPYQVILCCFFEFFLHAVFISVLTKDNFRLVWGRYPGVCNWKPTAKTLKNNYKRRINMKRRVFAVIMLVIMIFSAVACTKTENEPSATSTPAPTAAPTAAEPAVTGPGTVLNPDNELTVLIGSHGSYPYDENWKIWQYVKEAMGGKITIDVISDSWDTKISLLMATRDQLPDIIHMPNKTTVDRYALDGPFVSILDNLDKLPNFKQWMDSNADSAEFINSRKSGDGNVYHFPSYGLHTINNIRTWLYREDIFKKNNLSVPQDWNELYEVGKKLKEIYPDSYPIANREAMNKLSIFGPQWKPYMQNKFYYDYNSSKWSYGVTEDEFKQLFTFYKKLYDEGLLPVNLLTMNSTDWRTIVANNQGFIFNDYTIRIDMFQEPARKENPDFTLTPIEPPKGLTANASRLMPKTNSEYTGYVICNTGKKERIANAFKYVDWFYSKEGSDLVSWGKEGETYKVVDGKKQFILDEKGTPARNLYGVGTYGLYQVVEVTSNEALYTPDNVEKSHQVLNWLEEKFNPYEWLSLNDAETMVRTQIEANIDAFVNEQLAKFFLSERPMSEWDDFVKKIYDMGLNDMLKIYEQAYERAKK